MLLLVAREVSCYCLLREKFHACMAAAAESTKRKRFTAQHNNVNSTSMAAEGERDNPGPIPRGRRGPSALQSAGPPQCIRLHG